MEEKMANVIPRVYRSFEDFERSELRKLDHLYDSVDDMIDDMVLSELNDASAEDEDGFLFDDVDDEIEDEDDE